MAAALARIQQGNFSNAKGVGAGVYEYRIDFGPGYRIYFGKDGEAACDPCWRRDEETSAGTTLAWHSTDGKTTNNEKKLQKKEE